MHALGRKVLARDQGVFGGHAQSGAAANRGGIVEAAPHRDAQPAAADAQIDRLVEPLSAVLDQHILAGHTDVGRAILHIGGHVACAHDDQAQPRVGGRQNQFARIEHRRIDGDTGRSEQGQGLVEDAALGERQRDHASTTVRTRSIWAPTAASLRSMRS